MNLTSVGLQAITAVTGYGRGATEWVTTRKSLGKLVQGYTASSTCKYRPFTPDIFLSVSSTTVLAETAS